MGAEEGGKPPSYSNVTANDKSGTRAKRPAFEPPQQIREQLLAKEQGLRQEMETKLALPIPKHLAAGNPGNASHKWKRHPDIT
jgi:hypothetical protein